MKFFLGNLQLTHVFGQMRDVSDNKHTILKINVHKKVIDLGSSDSKNWIFKKDVTKSHLIFNDHCGTYHNKRQTKTTFLLNLYSNNRHLTVMNNIIKLFDYYGTWPEVMLSINALNGWGSFSYLSYGTCPPSPHHHHPPLWWLPAHLSTPFAYNVCNKELKNMEYKDTYIIQYNTIHKYYVAK